MRSLTRLHESTTQNKSNCVGLCDGHAEAWVRFTRPVLKMRSPLAMTTSRSEKECDWCFGQEAKGHWENYSRLQL